MGILRDTYTIFEKEMQIWAKAPVVNLVRAFMMPVLWLVIFGSAFGGTVSNVPVAIVMADNGHYAQLYAQSINYGNTLHVTADTNYAHALDMLKNAQVTAVVFIPPGFSDSVASGKPASVQVSEDTTTPLLSTAVGASLAQGQQVFSNAVLAEKGAGGVPSVPVLNVQQNILYGRGMTYLDFMAAGVIVQVMVFSALFAGGMGIIMDRELGTLKMLMSAPIDKMSIVLGKITAGVAQSLVSGAVALMVAIAIGVKVQTGLMGFFLVFVFLTLVAFGFIGMTVALAARIKTLQSFMMAVQTLVMPLWFLSGSLYPIQTMPDWLRPISVINPLTYATDAVRSLMIRGVIWSTLEVDFVVLVVFSAAMVFIGSMAFSRTLD